MQKIGVSVLSKIDNFIVKLYGWKHIPYSKNNFMYIAPHVYKGQDITLKDGTIVSGGDLIAELHIDNKNIKFFNTAYPNLLKLLKGELSALKQSFSMEPYSKIKAVYGISVFYDIASRQGFTIIDMHNPMVRFFGSVWENLLRLGLKNSTRKTRKKFVISKECWLSMNQVLSMK